MPVSALITIEMEPMDVLILLKGIKVQITPSPGLGLPRPKSL